MPPRERRPRGYIAELPSGSWRAVVYAGINPLTGKQRQLRETAKTHAAAEDALTKLQREVDEDRHPKTAITVRQTITQWLDVAELEDTTRERYDDLIRLPILPVLGDMLASKLDAELLERFYASSSATGCPLSLSSPQLTRSQSARPTARWRYLGTNASSGSPVTVPHTYSEPLVGL